ncbi:MAG: AAA domain-containing protein [Clostridiaceae bacterium]
MDTSKHMIIHKDKDKDITAEVKSCNYNPITKKYDVTFQNDKVYTYNVQSIEWMRSPKSIDPKWYRIRLGEQVLFNIRDIYEFKGTKNYWRIRYTNGTENYYDIKKLEITQSCLTHEDAKSPLEYLNRISACNELRSEDGTVLLHEQYKKLEFVDENSAMATYLNPKRFKMETFREPDLIFPFGGNASQFKAVKNAMTSQISVIQGPPGTGKTQTILNIIANLLVQGKSVLVVSNNNSATANVLEKLSSEQYEMGFLLAPLGKSENKSIFIEKQTGKYPDLTDWKMNKDAQGNIRRRMIFISNELNDVFMKQERLAITRQELDSLKVEIMHFMQYCEETGLENLKANTKRTLQATRLLKTWQECYEYSLHDRRVSLWFKIKNIRILGVSDWKFYKRNLSRAVTQFQRLFYEAKQSELEKEIANLTNSLKDADQKMKNLTSMSMGYLRAKLFERVGNRRERDVFTAEDLWKKPNSVLKEYPIALSTTFSSRSSLGGDAMFDYLIMDEASQVDVAAGALALSCAKNAVIVGDLKQLPNVVTEDMKKITEAIFQSYHLPEGYSYSRNSFLKSICSVIPNVPQTLLKEHYRCHPKIIGFCNQKFYNNELIVMTEDHGEKDALLVYRTPKGNHKRELFNQRQIDVLCKEALPRLTESNSNDIGIIAPYNAQVNAIRDALNQEELDVATVHKFQGREKETIILTSVDDVVNDFSDDPYLLNVAISRAKKRLCLVVSGNEQPLDSNIGDLISYIEYNNLEVIQSEIYSVFDYLYQQYTAERMEFLKRHKKISAYDSENLMYGMILDILKEYPELSLGVICHQPLSMLIRDPKHLNDDECRYAMNTATHVDFLIYHKITKKPGFAIEVDGFHFHKEGSKQKQRDKMKDRILERYSIPLLRFATTGSGEKEAIGRMIEAYKNSRS